ncbi:Mrp/NBP35 family ATP-binding protein [Ichthyobacterium seriolicida]|uniref:Iron-sulfur cluster carrier protein n=1 Tax=Ichthyobacterium seriolicida TaxID=242600 RepID=A0A1J1EBR6_9FLAO|nr:Mrp/NBP35 family ATP-binding protein [Ichthyobacterium seriolicida]BAV95379.1 hypothetical protein JBKA6_1366 [Ichthyobacterium seriolicida]
MDITRSYIIEKLRLVYPHNSHRNIVDVGMIKDVVISPNSSLVEINVASAIPVMHIKEKLKNDILKVLSNSLNEGVDIKVNVSHKYSSDSNINNIKNVVCIASGKGGVGKSTVSSNLAVSLSKKGFKVGLIDADVYGPSMHIMFGVPFEKPYSVNIKGENMIKPIDSHGVKLLSLGFFTEEGKAIVWRGPMATKALTQMIHKAHWGELDFLLVDLPPGTSDIHLSLVQQVCVTGAIIVSTPQHIAISDVKRGVEMFQSDEINVPILGVVENMSYFTPQELPENKYYIFGKNGVKDISEDLNIPFLGQIPLVQSIRECADVGMPIVLQENNPNTEIFSDITDRFLEKLDFRNKNIKKTEKVKITGMSGCSK